MKNSFFGVHTTAMFMTCSDSVPMGSPSLFRISMQLSCPCGTSASRVLSVMTHSMVPFARWLQTGLGAVIVVTSLQLWVVEIVVVNMNKARASTRLARRLRRSAGFAAGISS